MKIPVSFSALFLFGLLIWAAQPASAQNKNTFYHTLVTVNGHPIDQESLDLNNRGVLALIDGVPGSREVRPMPFRAYLRRAGAVVRKGPSSATNAVYSVQLAELLPLAHIGDELVVEWVRQTDKIIRRTIRLKSVNWVTWLILMNEGC